MAAFKKSPLDGYWEEGYHYYLYISGTKAVLRDYAKRIIFKTSVKYDKKSLASGEKTELTLGETVLSRAADGEPMTWVKGLYYENGDKVMDYYYTIMGDTTYVLKKVDRDPFSNLVIRDARNLMLTDEPEPPVCGGTDETFDTSAPKEISSTDMTFFSVTSALNREYAEEDTRRGRTAPLASFGLRTAVHQRPLERRQNLRSVLLF